MKSKIAAVLIAFGLATARASAVDKARAYELYEQKRFEEAAEQFRLYVQENPGDTQAAFDFAGLLSQLNRHADAAKIFESLYRKNARNESAYFKLGVEYVQLQRFADAAKVFTALEESANPDMARSAAESKRQLQRDIAKTEKHKDPDNVVALAPADAAAKRLKAGQPGSPAAEDKVFDLARKGKHREVAAAIDELEKQGPLSWTMELQRLYAWQSAGDQPPP